MEKNVKNIDTERKKHVPSPALYTPLLHGAFPAAWLSACLFLNGAAQCTTHKCMCVLSMWEYAWYMVCVGWVACVDCGM